MGAANLSEGFQNGSDDMSTAEQLEDIGGGRPAARHAARGKAFIETQLTHPAKSAPSCVRCALALTWRDMRSRDACLVSLTIASIHDPVVPVAVRRMIDFGFSPEGIAMINSYFSVMIAVVAMLAGASASRYIWS